MPTAADSLPRPLCVTWAPGSDGPSCPWRGVHRDCDEGHWQVCCHRRADGVACPEGRPQAEPEVHGPLTLASMRRWARQEAERRERVATVIGLAACLGAMGGHRA
jgi:hypothetical protein